MLGKRASVDTVIAYLKEKKVAITVIVINCDGATECLSGRFQLTLSFFFVLTLDSKLHTNHISARPDEPLGHRLVAWKRARFTGMSAHLCHFNSPGWWTIFS